MITDHERFIAQAIGRDIARGGDSTPGRLEGTAVRLFGSGSELRERHGAEFVAAGEQALLDELHQILHGEPRPVHQLPGKSLWDCECGECQRLQREADDGVGE